MMINIKEHFKSLHQDAVMWKAQRIWNEAKTPDDQIFCVEKLLLMLNCIGNNIKKDSYINRIAETFTADAKKAENNVKAQQKKIDAIEAILNKIKDKGKLQSTEYLAQKKLYDREYSLLLELNALCLPKLSAAELKNYIKEDIDKKEAAAKKEMERTGKMNKLRNEDLGLPGDFDGDTSDVLNYGIYAYKGRYYSRNNKGVYDDISNFTMRILFHVDTSDIAAYRLIVIKNTEGIERTINVNTDEMTSVANFKKILQRQGYFIFKGNDADLSRLLEFLQKNEKPTTLIDTLGYSPRYKFWAWANGLIDTEKKTGNTFYPIDEYGIVEFKDKNYFIPAYSKMFADKDALYEDEKRYLYNYDGTIKYNEWSDLFLKVYGAQNGSIGIIWTLAAMFRDIIYSMPNIRATPILNLEGQRGSGKDAFANSLISLFGQPQKGVGLESTSTPKGFQRKFAQYRNGVVWLNEYKNNIKQVFIAALKEIYDGKAYTRAKMTNDLQTQTIPVNSACMLSGQEMPTIEPALFSRCIMLSFKPGKDRSDTDKKNFQKLKSLEDNNISNITSEILQLRNVMTKEFKSLFENKLSDFFKKTRKEIDDRFIMNIAILSTTNKLLSPLLNPNNDYFKEILFDRILIENLDAQFNIMEGNDDLGKFWQVVENLASLRLIAPGTAYRYNNSNPDNIYIKIQDIYPLYLKELRMRNDNNVLSRSTLIQYLQNDKQVYVGESKQRMGNASYWTTEFNYKVIQERYKIEIFNSDMNNEVDNNEWKSGQNIKGDNKPTPF